MAEFLQQGVAIHFGTRNERLEPNGARVMALTVEDDRQHVIAYVPAIAAPRVLPDLEANGHGAVTVARPIDDRAAQVKGVFVSSWQATDEERLVVQAQWERCLGRLEAVGIPRSAAANWSVWPCVAIRLRVNAVFDQTPGPRAGEAVP
jgi:hypothetical protein